MNLAEIFEKVAHKQLAKVDIPNAGSNQHELNGIGALKDFFGTQAATNCDVGWHRFGDAEPEYANGQFTFYDARAKSVARTGRTEWRLYYTGDFLAASAPGDLLVLVAEKTSKRIHALVFSKGSSWHRAATQLFQIETEDPSFVFIPRQALAKNQIHFLQERIIDELDLDITLPAKPNDAELVLRQFPGGFPSTKEMSSFARSCAQVEPRNPDDTLIAWLQREEELFRALEKTIVVERLESGFADVDDFMRFSLSVQNRRKSRMGHALQNHLEQLFKQHRLHFTPQARTEGCNRPDFIFPGEQQYHDPSFSKSLLVMLGVKSSSKDRWRQVLAEADRIKNKHLCTLEAGISEAQTNEMRRHLLTLVLPESLHPTYTPAQRRQLLSVTAFIEHVREKQTHG